MKQLTNVFIFLFITSLSFGQMEEYNYKRELKGISDKWHKIELPAELFSKLTNNLSDIRIFGSTQSKDTIEVPYILKSTEDKILRKEIAFKTFNSSSNENGYYFTFENLTSTTINKIILDFEQQNFDWRIQLEGGQNQNEWFTILENYRIMSLKNEQSDFQFTTLNFTDSKYRFYRLYVMSKEKPDLTFASMQQNDVSRGSCRNYAIKEMKSSVNKETRQTVIDVELQYFVPVNRLKIGVKDAIDYYRPVTIKYLSDSLQTEMGWKYTYSALAVGTLNSLEENEFSFSSTMSKKFKIIIENQDNRPLTINSVEVIGYNYQLLARFTEPADYFIVYGNAYVDKPNYDIEQFIEKIPQNLSLATLGKEQIIDKVKTRVIEPLFKNKAWLWGVLSFMILILGWFSLKMIGNK